MSNETITAVIQQDGTANDELARADQRQRIISGSVLLDDELLPDAERLLLKIDPSGEDPTVTELYETIEAIKENFTQGAAVIAKEREESLRFAEWIAHNGYIRLSNDLWYKNNNGAPNDGLSIAQLRELYEKSKICDNCGQNQRSENHKWCMSCRMEG